jgi:hypothetical protein
VGLLFTNPYRNNYYYSNNLVSIRINNQTLYNPELDRINAQIIDELQLSFHGITRLDIAYDTNVNLLTKFKRFYNNPNRYTYVHREQTYINGTGKFDATIYIGSQENTNKEKQTTFYYKSNLLKHQEKAHLSEVFESVFGSENVFRVEVHMYSRFTKKFDIDLFNLTDKTYLENLFRLVSNKSLDFRDKRSNTNITRQIKIPFMELNGSSVKITQKLKSNSVKGNNTMKHLIWKLHNDMKKEEFAAMCREIKMLIELYTKMSGLQDWYRIKMISER